MPRSATCRGGKERLPSTKDRAAKEDRLAAIEDEIMRTVELNAKADGHLDAALRIVGELQAEKTQLQRELMAQPAPIVVDAGAIRPVIEAAVKEIREALEGSPETAGRFLRTLIGEERVTVRSDDEKGFALEGMLGLTLETERDAAGGPRRLVSVVAGARYESVQTRTLWDVFCAA